MKTLQLGETVKLVTFEGSEVAPEDVRADENYWKLIGGYGWIAAGPERRSDGQNRVLIKFNVLVSSLGLACHNIEENSLWILVTDLRVI